MMTSVSLTIAAARAKAAEPSGAKPMPLTASRAAVYAFLGISALFFLMPLYVMIVTAFKPMAEIRLGHIFALPTTPTMEPWIRAWSSACTGLTCTGVSGGFWNSVRITLPAVVCSVALGAVNGYALSFWRFRGANLIFAILMAGAFIPLQVFIYPLVRITAAMSVFGTLEGAILLHICFSLPLMTLLFRNFYTGVPYDLFKAARVDGAGFWQMLVHVFAPMSVPITVVAFIIQLTGTWNDFVVGLVFAGSNNMPITVVLNNIVNSQFGEREYNVDMAATILAGLVPLVLYFVSGRWFVRGIMAGAVKG